MVDIRQFQRPRPDSGLPLQQIARRGSGGPSVANMFGPVGENAPARAQRQMQPNPNVFQQVLERIRQQQPQQPNILQRTANDVQPNILQRVGRQVNPQISSAIDTTLQRQQSVPQRRGSSTGASAFDTHPEFARRAQDATDRGMTPADRRFQSFNQEPEVPAISESGQRLGLETGKQFDDGWLNEIDTDLALTAWNDPQTAARIVLQANGFTEDSRFGQYWMELSSVLPDLYRQQAAEEPGSVAVDGSDFLAFSQGYLETLMSPAGSSESQATLQSMNDFGGQQLNAIFNDPESDISVRVQTAVEEAAQYGEEADVLYQMAIAPAIRNYSGIDKQIIEAQLTNHYEQYKVKSATGYPGGFLAYLRDETNFLNQIT